LRLTDKLFYAGEEFGSDIVSGGQNAWILPVSARRKGDSERRQSHRRTAQRRDTRVVCIMSQLSLIGNNPPSPARERCVREACVCVGCVGGSIRRRQKKREKRQASSGEKKAQQQRRRDQSGGPGWKGIRSVSGSEEGKGGQSQAEQTVCRSAV
jgi:hypothetical protein